MTSIRKKLLTTLLGISFTSNALGYEPTPQPPDDSPPSSPTESSALTCFTQIERDKIAQGLIEREKCLIELSERNKLINDKLLNINGTPDYAFWQEPEFVVGGMVVSVALGALISTVIAGNSK